MSKELDIKYNLGCEIRSNKGRTVIVLRNYDRFISLSGNYIISEMKFKLP